MRVIGRYTRVPYEGSSRFGRYSLVPSGRAVHMLDVPNIVGPRVPSYKGDYVLKVGYPFQNYLVTNTKNLGVYL